MVQASCISTAIAWSVVLLQLLIARELDQSDSSIGCLLMIGQVLDESTGPLLSEDKSTGIIDGLIG